MSDVIASLSGRWWIALVAAGASIVLFAWVVPAAIGRVTQNRTLWPKILDEYYPTWPKSAALGFFEALGPSGRQAYRKYYLQLDFWFPVLSMSILYAALLSLAFPAPSTWRQLNLLVIVMYLSDVAENINHFTMAGSYPRLPSFQLAIGPVFSFVKYALITLLPLAMLIGFAGQYLR